MNTRTYYIVTTLIISTLALSGCAVFDASGSPESDDAGFSDTEHTRVEDTSGNGGDLSDADDASSSDADDGSSSDADDASSSDADDGDSSDADDGDSSDADDGDSSDADDGDSSDALESECSVHGDCALHEECDTNAGVCVPSATEREFGPASRVMTLEIADNDCCFDVNGDGAYDNTFSLFTQMGDEVNTIIQDSIDAGSLVIIFEHEGLDHLSNSSPYTLNMWRGEIVTAATSSSPVFLKIDPTSAHHGRTPKTFLPNAQTTSGALTAGPGVIDIKLPFLGFTDPMLKLRIRKAQLKATVDPSSSSLDPSTGGVVLKSTNGGGTGGKLGGAIRLDDFIGALNESIAASCECLDLNGIPFFTPHSVAPSCAPPQNDTCDASDPSICSELSMLCGMMSLLPDILDVDTDGDGSNDAMSIGVRFSADAAIITGIGNN